MGEKQISDKVEDISEITLEEEVSFLPSYTKSYAQTQFETIIFEYTWKIKHFRHFFKARHELFSPSFGEKGQYKIEINHQYGSQKLCFYMHTKTPYIDLCTTTLYSFQTTLISTYSISNVIHNKTLLIEVLQNKICQINDLTVHVKLEIFGNVLSNSIHMNLSPSIVKSQDSTLELDSKKFIIFKLGNEQHVVSKKLLCATNSSYFKNICLARVEEEIDLTNELTKNNELYTFEQMLLFILTGSVNDYYYNDYYELKALLTTAEKYDVPTLKLTCEHYLLRDITIENAIELRLLALSANAKFLETHSTTFIKFHIKEIIGTKKFQDLPAEDKNKIIELIE